MPIIVKYYPVTPGQTRRVKARYIVDDNGKKQGLFQSYYRDGSDSVTCWYKDDKKHGKYMSRHPNGRTATECSYDEDNLEGDYRTNYPTGLPSFIGHFHRNLGEGKQTWFRPNGDISCYEFQHLGLREGKSVSFSFGETVCAIYKAGQKKAVLRSRTEADQGNISKTLRYQSRRNRVRLLARQARSERSDISRRTALKMENENYRS